MCGRFTIASRWEAFKDEFGSVELDDEWVPRYNVAPSQMIPILTNQNPSKVLFVRWGLVPFWAEDVKIGYKMINARAESLEKKMSFKEVFISKRCLILADGFFEWKKGAEGKTPFLIRMKQNKPFSFAGLWERGDKGKGGSLLTCTIITTEATPLVASIHDRMPVIIPKESRAGWLDHRLKDPAKLRKFLMQFDSNQMEAFPVSNLVNNPHNDDPRCIIPVK